MVTPNIANFFGGVVLLAIFGLFLAIYKLMKRLAVTLEGQDRIVNIQDFSNLSQNAQETRNLTNILTDKTAF